MNMLRRNSLPILARYYNTGAQNPSLSSKSKGAAPEVPGLSSAVVLPSSSPVGPNVDPKKTGAYKVPEYFCYNSMSFFEAEIEMSKFRLPQPSSVKK